MPREERLQHSQHGERATWAEFLAVLAGFTVLTAVLTWPLAAHPGSLGYKAYAAGDAQFSIWNVAWVAHALLTDPIHVFDANIFYPHRQTLTYSEANIVAGAVAAPVYAVTGNPFAAHNFAVLISFVLAGAAMYYLARYLTGDWRAAAIAGIAFAYCPYAFSKLPQIQLLMTFGIPLVLLAFHRLADEPGPRRGVWLGLALTLQVWACAYYGVFVALLTSALSLAVPMLTRTWSNVRYWTAVGIAAGLSGLLTLPLVLPYLRLQESGFGRTLEESREYSATLRSYLTSSTYATGWLAPLLFPNAKSYDSLFPGVVALGCGIAALFFARGWDARRRRLVWLYGGIALLAWWLSLGPVGGLYVAAYQLPIFDFLRAPSRFGVLVTLSLAVLAALAVTELLRRAHTRAFVAFALIGLAIAEQVLSRNSFLVRPVPVIAPAYSFLASQPPGAVLELPPFSKPFERTRHMINSMANWYPLVNGYSDFIPQDFSDNVGAYSEFPSELAFSRIPTGVRYVVFTLSHYAGSQRDALAAKLAAFSDRVRRTYADEQTWVYEIIDRP